jgi:hypothetical protein
MGCLPRQRKPTLSCHRAGRIYSLLERRLTRVGAPPAARVRLDPLPRPLRPGPARTIPHTDRTPTPIAGYRRRIDCIRVIASAARRNDPQSHTLSPELRTERAYACLHSCSMRPPSYGMTLSLSSCLAHLHSPSPLPDPTLLLLSSFLPHTTFLFVGLSWRVPTDVPRELALCAIRPMFRPWQTPCFSLCTPKSV